MQDITEATIEKICKMVTYMDSLSGAILHSANEKLYEIGSKQGKSQPGVASILADGSIMMPTFSMEIAAKYSQMAKGGGCSVGTHSTILRASNRNVLAKVSASPSKYGAGSSGESRSLWSRFRTPVMTSIKLGHAIRTANSSRNLSSPHGVGAGGTSKTLLLGRSGASRSLSPQAVGHTVEARTTTQPYSSNQGTESRSTESRSLRQASTVPGGLASMPLMIQVQAPPDDG